MTQRKIVFTLAGLFVAILPATAGAVGAAAGAGASTSTGTPTSTTPAAAAVAPAAPVEAPPLTTEQSVTAPAAAKHVRGGGLFRLALGSGFMFGETKHDDGTKWHKRGLTFTSELAVGGTLTSGLAVGAAVYGNVPAAETEAGAPTFIMLTCPFADIYVDPTKGFHLVGAPCFVMGRYENEGVWLQGWGANLGIGYEWSALWGSSLGKGWGLGVLARVQYVSLLAKDIYDPFNAIMPGLLISATWY